MDESRSSFPSSAPPSALRIPCSTTTWIDPESRKRTSVLAGWTLTSTEVGSISRNSTIPGCPSKSNAMAARHPAGCVRGVIRLVDLGEELLGVGAEDLDDARERLGGGRQIEHEAIVVHETERARRQRQRVGRHHRDDRSKFRLGAAEKLPARRHMLEEPPADHRRAALTR